MPETTQLQFSHKEIAEMMTHKAGIIDGHWQLCVSFAWHATNIAAHGGLPLPSAIAQVQSIGLMRVPAPNEMSVDAAASEWQETIEV